MTWRDRVLLCKSDPSSPLTPDRPVTCVELCRAGTRRFGSAIARSRSVLIPDACKAVCMLPPVVSRLPGRDSTAWDCLYGRVRAVLVPGAHETVHVLPAIFRFGSKLPGRDSTLARGVCPASRGTPPFALPLSACRKISSYLPSTGRQPHFRVSRTNLRGLDSNQD